MNVELSAADVRGRVRAVVLEPNMRHINRLNVTFCVCLLL